MLYLSSGLFLAFGMAIGAGIVGTFFRSQIAQARKDASAAVGAERATLIEQLRQSEYRIYESQQAIERERSEHYATRTALYGESERRVAAEARNQHIAELEVLITGRDNLITDLQASEVELRMQIAALQVQLRDEQRAFAEKEELLNRAERKFADTFAALSANALRNNNESFVTYARATLQREQAEARGDLERRQQAIDGIVRPISDSLRDFDVKVGDLEVKRAGAYTELQTQVKALQDTQAKLQAETANLVTALRSPAARGRWGELQLRNVVEVAGMLQGYDFQMQESVSTEDGLLRPDMVVRLPGSKTIVVDAKTPLDAYLRAVEASEEQERDYHLRQHARQVREHVGKLSEKRYWEQFANSPEFVVMFLPGEAFFSAALEHDTTLIEAGANKKIILATPTTLIALFHVIHHGWQQEKIARNAEEIGSLGRELYKRLCTLGEHWMKVGKNLESATKAYNEATGSLDSRVFTQARRFKELGAAERDLEVPEVAHVSLIPRISHTPEIQDVADGD